MTDLSAGRNGLVTAGNTEDINMGTDSDMSGLNEYIYSHIGCNKISYFKLAIFIFYAIKYHIYEYSYFFRALAQRLH